RCTALESKGDSPAEAKASSRRADAAMRVAEQVGGGTADGALPRASLPAAATRLSAMDQRCRALLDALPAAIYTTDAAGRISFYNGTAAILAGRRPVIGVDMWCVSWRLYTPDGALLPHDQCPMAIALKENRPVRGAEVVVERPDGTRRPFIAYPTPLR